MRLTAHVAEALHRAGDRIVITGAGGWLGLATTHLLAEALGDDFGHRVVCFGSRERTLTLWNGRTVAQRELGSIADLYPAPTIVLHTAFLTKDRAESMDEEEYCDANRRISAAVLDGLDAIGATSVFVASSGAAGVADDPTASSAMRLYGRLKRDDEAIFSAWADDRGRRAAVARIFNLSGPYINKVHSYALACFIRDALAGRPIQVRAPHRVIRGYVAIRELMSLVFAQLLEDRGVTHFETGGRAVELGDVAAEVSMLVGCGKVERAVLKSEKCDEYAGDDDAYQRLLERYSIEHIGLSEQIRETAEYLERI